MRKVPAFLLRSSFLFLLLGGVVPTLPGQVHNSVHDTLRVKAVFDIAELVTWPQQERIDTFQFGLLSQDERLFKEFQRQSSRRIHERPVQVHLFKELQDLENTRVDLLFIQRRGDWDIGGVKQRIEGDSTLLIAENYPFYQTMISFIFQEGGTRWLVFRKPFLEKGFSYDKDLEGLATVKTQADWKRAFKHTEGRLAQRKKELRKKEEELKEQKAALKELKRSIRKKKERLKKQRKELQEKKDTLEALKRSMRKQERVLAAKRKEVRRKSRELDSTLAAIEKQKAIFAEHKKKADSLQKHISAQKERIQEQKGTLQAQHKRITYQTYALLAFGILILTVLIFSYLLYRNYRRIKTINKELAEKNDTILEQNERIEEKNKEITESITYASKIQHAMLPSLGVLQENFEDHSVLYIPRDIVSGDFYWAARPDGKLIWTAADCTGHGVPGAMMSMLGMAFLREVVTRKGILEPDRIMNEVRDMIVRSLSSEEGEDAKDGMDMGLCALDRENGELDFAGANNPLYLIFGPEGEDPREFPEDSKEITGPGGERRGIEIKADKQPVGAHAEGALPFTRKRTKVKKGDRLYLFSDGYADQFGGDKGKKLKYKPFKHWIIESAHLSLKEQRDFLKERFDEWKGTYEQVDDVVVLAVEV